MKPLLVCLPAVFALLSDLAPGEWSPGKEPRAVSLGMFTLPEELEVTVWASTPQLYNPTNMDIGHAGRIWVAEGVNYRNHRQRRPAGDRIVVLEDTDGDGRCDRSHTFVQDPELVAPLGVAVFDNILYVSQPPSLLVYTDVNRDLVFEAGVDKKQVLLTGFNARNHDHSLHSVTAGPDGKFYFNNGNCGAIFTDNSGRTFYMGGTYGGGIGDWFVDHKSASGKRSSDGHVWTSGFTVRMNPDGTECEIVGHGYRNSYEQTLTSFGDMFQNDNDDPPACRTSFVLESGSAGYFTRDGKQDYRAVKRPGQEHGRNHWRQDDPGTMDAGDVYGGGSPTGIAFYENGALGEKWNGTLLSCEPARNVLFGYQPVSSGANFALERFDFVTTNPAGEFDGADFTGGAKKNQSIDKEIGTLFRPSDVAVGPDGAIYVCDWFDPRVGGHADLDDSCSGTIYRIAPKGFQPTIPEFDLATTEGQLAALQSPAVNTRHLGFRRLAEQGAAAYEAVAKLLEHDNKWIAARAVWLLPHLGEQGVKRCENFLKHDDAAQRALAYRALRRAGRDILPWAAELAQDPSPQVRREVALSLRDQPADRTKAIFVDLAKRCDVSDKNALEALGLGAANQESVIWLALREGLEAGAPEQWDDRFARLTWRLWPVAAVKDLTTRALSATLSPEARALAVESLAFIDDRAAVEALLKLAAADSPARAEAAHWLLRNATGEWSKYDLGRELKAKGIYDPDTIEVVAVTVPEPPNERTLPPLEEILALEGDAARGATTARRCIMCHEIDGQGPNYGPNLRGWGKGQTAEVLARSLVDPSADIAHGYQGTVVEMHDGKTVHGIAFNEADPLVVQSTGGVTQLIPHKRIKRRSELNRSLMLSAQQQGLTAQDVADLVAFLKGYE